MTEQLIHDLEAKKVTMYDFFRLIVFSAKANVPHFMMNGVIRKKDPKKMYEKAKQEGVMFHQFYEWVLNDIERDKFNFDAVMDNEIGIPEVEVYTEEMKDNQKSATEDDPEKCLIFWGLL